MGQLEQNILNALVSLRDARPDADRHMFVFPLTLMATNPHEWHAETVVIGDVMLVCRDGEELKPPPT